MDLVSLFEIDRKTIFFNTYFEEVGETIFTASLEQSPLRSDAAPGSIRLARESNQPVELNSCHPSNQLLMVIFELNKVKLPEHVEKRAKKIPMNMILLRKLLVYLCILKEKALAKQYFLKFGERLRMSLKISASAFKRWHRIEAAMDFSLLQKSILNAEIMET